MASLLNARDFVRELVQLFGADQIMELDYCDFTEMAEKHHLVRWEDYEFDKHGEMDAETGDRVWVPNDIEPFLCRHCGEPIAVKNIEGKHFVSCECTNPPTVTTKRRGFMDFLTKDKK